MNILLIILLSKFVFIKGGNLLTSPSSRNQHGLRFDCSIPESDYTSQAPNHLRIQIKEGCQILQKVNLKQTERVLANEHLPIWILKGPIDINFSDIDDGHELHRNYEVMKQLGRFTTFQEPEMTSAAIYFHKRREFDGMIGSHFFIEKLAVHEKCHGTRTCPLGHPGIHQQDYTKHQSKFTVDNPTDGVNNQKLRKTYEGHLYDGYPEVLVIVSEDVTKFWTLRLPRADWYTAVVSNVLTLFNGVDMLYSKLVKTKIQINIAGIIIGIDEESFLFLYACYYRDSKTNASFKYKLDGSCINGMFRNYLSARKNIIPIDSYDMVIFLTRKDIFQVLNKDRTIEDLKFTRAHGVSSVMYELYENRRRDFESILVGTISIPEDMEIYPTVAHEMAHLMTVRHDRPPFFIGDKCCARLMKSTGDYCDQCLSWSESSEETFQFFYSSPNCCTFINKPQSLHPPGRRQLLTADEQCQCHGFKSARKYEELPFSYCDDYLECNGEIREFHRTAIPLDGTLCGANEVCYQRTCQEITDFEPVSSLE